MSPSYLHRERVLFTESSMLLRHVSTVAQNGQTQTLALERDFRFFTLPDGQRSSPTRLWNWGNLNRRVRLTSVAPKVVLLWYGWPLSKANVTTVLHSAAHVTAVLEREEWAEGNSVVCNLQ